MNSASSALYECRVMHHRLMPKVHRFAYRVFYLWLDLDSIDGLARRLWCFSRNRWNLLSFHDQDHVSLGAADVKSNLLLFLQAEGFNTDPIASIRLLTFPRVLGYGFNPVCFYFAFDAHGQPLCAVAEVTNTFREQKLYLLTTQDNEADSSVRFRLLTPKHFYVSPFFGLELCFDFKLRVPNEHLEIHVDDYEGSQRVLVTTLTGERRELSNTSLLLALLRHPLLTLRVISLIHWHALRLWIKRVPWHRKSANAHLQRDVLRPHASLAKHQP